VTTVANWYDDEGAIGRDRLREILAGIPSDTPLPPLLNDILVRCYMAEYERRGGSMKFWGREIHNPEELGLRLAWGHIDQEEYDHAREAFYRLGI
jgi:hypothetical protein